MCERSCIVIVDSARIRVGVRGCNCCEPARNLSNLRNMEERTMSKMNGVLAGLVLVAAGAGTCQGGYFG